MNTIKHWENFYKNNEKLPPSDFARFCDELISDDAKVVELGCGDGRDTYYLAQVRPVIGVDAAVKPEDDNMATFIQGDISEFLEWMDYVDIAYCRFLFHSISENLMWEIFDKCNTVMAEFRVKGDVPKIYKDHKRREIDPYKLIKQLVEKGFEIDYFYVGHGMAVYKDEDPLVCRIICTK